MPVAASSINLPARYDANDLLAARFAPKENLVLVETGGTVTAQSNVSSVTDFTAQGQPARQFNEDAGFADLQMSQWVLCSRNNWSVGYGHGSREVYDGNADAAQLWIDLHTDEHARGTYAPTLSSVRADVTWYGISRAFAFQLDGIRGTGCLTARYLSADDLFTRSVTGEVDGEHFSGMMRTISATTRTGPVRGSGWAIDARAGCQLGERWQGQLAVEGLLGKLSWRKLAVDDLLITSPDVFEDAQGFLRDFGGGFSGAGWREDLTVNLTPRYRIDLISSHHPNLLLGMTYQANARTEPSIGMAWPQKTAWLPYLRCYPIRRRLELGAVSPRWQLRIAGDDWRGARVKDAEISLSTALIAF